MCLSKRRLLTTLVTVIIIAALTRFDFPAKNLPVLTANLRPARFASSLNGPLGYTGKAANDRVRSSWVVPAKTQDPAPTFLPVQSRDPRDFGVGKLLVASRTLVDPNFAETVVLLVRSNAEGVVGLILNRRTDVPISRVLDQFAVAKDRSDPVYLGGPVEVPVVFGLLRSTTKLEGADQILSDVSLVSTKDLFEKVIAAKPGPEKFRVYLGYAGWDNEQLRREIELGSWFIFQGDIKTIFDSDPNTLWRQMIQETELKLARS